MVMSMTGFSRCTAEAECGVLVWEIRSVNSRFLECNIRLPENLRQWEMHFRERIQAVIQRGKVEAILKFTPGKEVPFNLTVNESLLRCLSSALTSVQQYFPDSRVNAFDVMKWQGVLEIQETSMESVMTATMNLLNKALEDLTASRAKEGDALKLFIQTRLQELQQQIQFTESCLPKLKEQAHRKIINRFAELSLEINTDRLEQEMVWLLQKMDVAEEIQRLYFHIAEVERIMAENHPVGRKLDFFMQELNREANTLGSKSQDHEVTQAVVTMKVQIEQMREQVQNIE